LHDDTPGGKTASHSPEGGSVPEIDPITVNSKVKGDIAVTLYYNSSISCHADSYSASSPAMALTQVACVRRFKHGYGFRGKGKQCRQGTYSEYYWVFRTERIAAFGTLLMEKLDGNAGAAYVLFKKILPLLYPEMFFDRST